MSTVEIGQRQTWPDLGEKRPEGKDDGRPDAQRERDDADDHVLLRVAPGRAVERVVISLFIALQACWVTFLVYLAHRLVA